MDKNIGMLAVLLIFGIAFAQGEIFSALYGVKALLCNILPVVVMLAIVVAALLYAVGQLGSAESRAKFHGWATGIVIGAITALIVLLVTPVLLGGLLGDSSLVACSGSSGGSSHGTSCANCMAVCNMGEVSACPDRNDGGCCNAYCGC